MNCSSCPFFEPLQEQCRRNPPQAFVIPGADGRPAVVGAWPAARKENWCGEHPKRTTIRVVM